jgi:LPXTG-motif cell wall-anchored protein
MTKSTKKKLSDLQTTISVLNESQQKKAKTITYLLIGTAVLIAVVVFFVILKRRKK